MIFIYLVCLVAIGCDDTKIRLYMADAIRKVSGI